MAGSIEPFLSDEQEAIVVASLDAISRLKSQQTADRVLDLLRSSDNRKIIHACLDYFAKVHLREDAIVVSLLSVIDKTEDAMLFDQGDKLRLVRAVANQWGFNRDSVLLKLFDWWEAGDTLIRKEILSKLIENSDLAWVHSPSVGHRLATTLLSAFRDGTDREQALAWVAAFVLEESGLNGDIDRKSVWKSILAADKFAIKAFLQELEMYNVDIMLDSAEDLDGLSYLLKKYNDDFGKDIISVIEGLSHIDAFKILANYDYEPEGWGAVSLLRAIAKSEEFDASLQISLDTALVNLPDYAASEGVAFSLLAQFRAGKISLYDMVKEFPREFTGKYYRAEQDRRIIIELLEKIGKTQNSTLRRKIGRNIRSLES